MSNATNQAELKLAIIRAAISLGYALEGIEINYPGGECDLCEGPASGTVRAIVIFAEVQS